MHIFPIVEELSGVTALRTGLQATGDITKSATKSLRKGVGEIGGVATKSLKKGVDGLGGAVKKSFGETVEKAKKVLSETAQETLEKTQKVSKAADEAGETIGKTSSKVTGEAGENVVAKADDMTKIASDAQKLTPDDFLAKHGKKILVGAGGVTLASIVAVATSNANRINNTDFTITSIKKDPADPSYTIVSYVPEELFTKRDSVIISDSNSSPSIDGEYTAQPIRAGGIRINKRISKDGNNGSLKCYTTVSNQTSQQITDIVKPITSTAAGVAGGVAGDVLTDIIPEALKATGLGSSLGGIPLTSWIFFVVCILMLMCIFILIIIR
jgi:hypothetical protein